MAKFQKGNPGGPGRPKGSKHKLSEDFVKALSEDFEQHGADAIITCREDSAAQYLNVIAKILPRDLNVNITELDELTESELEERAGILARQFIEGLDRNSVGIKTKAKPKQTH